MLKTHGKKKKCKLCNLTKCLASFNPCKNVKDGRRNECKVCSNKLKLASKKANFDKLSEADKEKKREVWRKEYYAKSEYHKDRYRNLLKDDEKLLSLRFYQTKRNAKKRGYEFFLSKDEYSYLYFQPCIYCGEKESHGVDRFDNNIGYTILNSKPCCKTCNSMKMAHDVDFFINHINKILKNYEVKRGS